MENYPLFISFIPFYLEAGEATCTGGKEGI